MSSERYNGWTNRETWLVNLHYSDTIEAIFDLGCDVVTLADCIEDFVWERLNEELTTNSIFQDFVDLGGVNWRELAEHYITD